MGALLARWQGRRGRWWFVAMLILVPVVLGSALSVVLLLALVDAETAGDQIELIKTGLAVGAGTGGAVALVLAGRRQWSVEHTAEDVRHDATERRITDLYSKAADQLGSDKAAVRLAGLYSLERLAQDTPALRQTIVNLLCAYLRMPAETESTQEFEVRLTAQRVLCKHLRSRPAETFWPAMDLDLTGAVLHYFDLRDARLRDAQFGGADFRGRAWFDGATFDGQARFGGTRFELITEFRAVRFADKAVFRGATFAGPVVFDEAVFAGEAVFDGEWQGQQDPATFQSTVSFSRASFAVRPAIDSSVELD